MYATDSINESHKPKINTKCREHPIRTILFINL